MRSFAAILCFALMIAWWITTPRRRARAATTTVTADAGDVTVKPESLDFGKQVIGTVSKAQRVTVTNSGSAKVYVNSVAVGGDDWQQFSVTSDTCTGSTLDPQKSCIIDVVCTPAKQGSIKTVLSITNSASPQTVTLGGNGINSVDVPPSSLRF